MPALVEALEAGLDIVSGMHARLADIMVLREAAGLYKRRLIDVRKPPSGIPVATGLKRSGKRLLTVGTDCALGKKYTALALARALQRSRGQRRFPRHRADRDHDRRPRHPDGRGGRRLRRRRGRDAEPGRARRSLGRDRRPGIAAPPGVTPAFRCRCSTAASRTWSSICHDPSRERLLGDEAFAIPSVEEIVDLTIRLGSRTNPAIRLGGVSFNTASLGEDEARQLMAQEGKRLGLPVADPMRGGDQFERLVDACLG